MEPLSTLPILVVALVALVLALIGFFTIRADIRALGFWLLGWAAVMTSLCFSLALPEASTARAVGFLFSSLCAPLMLLGACAHVGAKMPYWVVPVGFLTGAERVFFHQIGSPDLAAWTGGLVSLVFFLLAAETIRRHSIRSHGKIPTSDRFLIAGFATIGLVGSLEAAALLGYLPADSLWLGRAIAGPPLFSFQVSLYLHRLGRNAEAQAHANLANAQRLTILTESTRDIVIELDDRGTILFVSANLGNVENLSPELLVGKSAVEFGNFGGDSPIAKSLSELGHITEESVAATPQPRIDRAVLADGSKIWLESTATTYRTHSGDLRILACVRDVTVRIDRQEAIEKNEQRLERAERIANLGSWECFPLDQKVAWSTQMVALHGLPPGRTHVDYAEAMAFVHPADAKSLSKAIKKATSTNGVVDLVYRIRRADDGTVRSLRTLIEVEFDDRGRLRRITGASMDITEQVLAEKQLRRGEERLNAFVDSNIVGIFFGEMSGRIPEANDAFLSMLGYSKEDLPLDANEITAADCLARDQAAREELARTGVALPYEKDFLSRTGERVTMLVGCATTGPDVVMIIALDLSERKRAEEYVHRYQLELEETIADRTHELMESRNRLIENDRLAAVGTLAAGVAHQINNPIGAILNSAEYALLCRDEADFKAVFEHALRVNLAEARRCARIVKSMLQFSRDEPTSKWQEDLNKIILRAHRAVSAYASDHAAVIQIELYKASVIALISPIEIEQAIVNVVRNAIESRDGGVSISVSLNKRDKHAEIEVLDDGRGIRMEERDRLVEPFYSTRTHVGGTGLGLSVAHGIVKEHGGEIRIDSIAGEGTRVLMLLPLVDADGDAA